MTSVSDIKQLMENAKKQIEERKKGLGLPEERIAAISALQARISQTMGSLGIMGAIPPDQMAAIQTAEERDRSLNLFIDAEGRTIDRRTGEVVQLQSRVPTLKANLRIQQKESKLAAKKKSETKDQKQQAAGTETPASEFVFTKTPLAAAAVATKTTEEKPAAEEPSSFVDTRLKIKSGVRNKRKLAFHDKGKFEDLAKKLRDRAKIEFLNKEIQKIGKKTGISSESKLALIQPKRFQKDASIPDIEWWDFAILNEPNYDSLDKLSENEIKHKSNLTTLIEHPIQMKPPTQSDKKIMPTVMLTAKERKKLRRQNRSEALKEEQEKIRLGLIPPPEPKVKISNLMRVLGTEAVQDPTKVEEYVRNQMAKRLKKHEEANAARKLTPEQRSEKKKRKILENTSLSVNVAVYRIRDINDPSVKFKIEANCNQLHMTGVIVLCKNLNVVVVEGGPKQQRKFRRLMLNRIKWSEVRSKKPQQNTEEDDEENDTSNEKNSCKLVWEGLVKQRSFSNVIFKTCPKASFAREYFKRFGCEHYWDIAQSDAIIEMSEN